MNCFPFSSLRFTMRVTAILNSVIFNGAFWIATSFRSSQ